MRNKHRWSKSRSLALLATRMLLRRRALLLGGPAEAVALRRAVPLDLSERRPFETALRMHIQAVFAE